MIKIDGKAFSQVILEKIKEEHNQYFWRINLEENGEEQ